MITPELLAYVSAQKRARVSNDVIRKILIGQGWPIEDVDTALKPNARATALPPLPTDPRSGLGEGSQAPLETKGWNWGAAGLTWIWGIRFKVWIAFLVFVPVIGSIWWIILGIRGNEWVKKQNPGIPNPELNRQVRVWNTWGLIFFLGQIALVLITIVVITTTSFFSLDSARADARDAKRKADMRTLSSTLMLYYDDYEPQSFPNSLGDIDSRYLPSLPQPPYPEESYGYATSVDRKHFLVYTKLEEDQEYFYVNDAGESAKQKSVPMCSNTCP